MTVDFELAGRAFSALNGGPGYPFNESMSIEVRCDTQDEVDRLWSRLTEDGEERPCGWLKDRFGVFWQVMPQLFFTLVDDPDPVKAQAAFAAMLQMRKIESSLLQEAYDRA
jgi:predicted 3-demethylubiquinone-9 3-methyltransferase (glyoxalase superfamily)